MLEGILGSLAWLAMNALYFDMRRKGRGGVSRLLLFWLGFPMTLFWFLMLPEGEAPERLEPPDDAEELLEQIRREKEGERGLERGDGSSN